MCIVCLQCETGVELIVHQNQMHRHVREQRETNALSFTRKISSVLSTGSPFCRNLNRGCTEKKTPEVPASL